MQTLIISEKNKAAKAIAEALGPARLIKKPNLSNVYYVASKEIYVIPLRGHLLEYRNSNAFKSWSKSNPRDIITNSNAIEKVPIKYANPYIKAIKEYSKICDVCIIGTDADIEGCNIGLFDALPIVKQMNPNALVSQMWLSSLEKNEIINKYNNTISPKFSWGESGEARAILDAVIGFSATREVTNTLKPLLEKINQKFVSIGRVQTALLYLIYLRDDLIKNFVPEPYYTIEAKLNHEGGILVGFHELNPFKKESEVQAKIIHDTIKDEKIAKIIKKTNDKTSVKPPEPLNTSKALILLTKTLKISANLALNTMNELYLNKIISYPRTESDVYKKDFDHLQYIKNFTSHSAYGKYVLSLLNENRLIPTRGKKDAGDHPPITPLESLELNSVKFKSEVQKKVYNILTRSYLALFGKDSIESRTILRLSIKDEPFILRSVALIYEGFLEIAPFLRRNYDYEVLFREDGLQIDSISLNEKKTQSPPAYTDTTLLKLMEHHNLGTKSTRPDIIQKLLNRNLIFLEKRNYYCTELGYFLIDNLKEIWLSFLKPDFTKETEELLEKIQEKKESMTNVINIVKERFLNLFDTFLISKKNLVLKFKDFEGENQHHFITKTSKKTTPLTSSACPSCKTNPMKLISTREKKRFLACSNENCKTFLFVPKKGRIQILNSICSICGFNVFKIILKKNGKPFFYDICPKCWTSGLKEKSGIGFCPQCQNFKIINDQCVEK